MFLVFALAKAIVLTHLRVLGGTVLMACLGQDALAALLFALVAALLRRPRISVAVYGICVVYTALNVPIALATGTFLTRPMLRAAGGPLADSILHYATWHSALATLSVLMVAALLPLFLSRWPHPARLALAAASMVTAAVGARWDTETWGLHRNVLLALSAATLAKDAPTETGDTDWRAPRTIDVAFSGPDLTPLRGAARGRNVILVGLESVAARYLALYGAPEELMPRVSEMAARGLVFENAYAVYPESIKGLFSVLCSTYPAFGVESDRHARLRTASLPFELRAAGYRTALFHSGRFDYLGLSDVLRDRGFDVRADAGDIGGERESGFGIDEGSTVRRILSWVDTAPQPFFVAYLPIAGHHPYETPVRGRFREDDELGRYRNALAYADSALGELIDGIRQRGLDDRTLWVLYGDHGEAFGQHPGNFGHTFFLYEENVHVPLVFAGIPRPPGTLRVKRPASLVDLAPTVVDLLGLPRPRDFQGGSLLPPEPRMAPLLADYSQGLLGLRDGRFKIIDEIGGRTRLFDLELDPEERRDLSLEQPGRTAWYRARVRGWAAAQRRYIEGPP